jgi:hypothetical protein
LVLQVVTFLLLAAASGLSFWLAVQQAVGSYFILLLLLSLGLLAPSAITAYRGFALVQASYILERDGLRLRWGLRLEDIPMTDIEWIRPASDLTFRLRLPFLSFAGAILGIVRDPNLGTVEFMASNTDSMLLVATARKIYAISPANAVDFIHSFQNILEMGSPTPIQSYSSLPAAYLQTVFSDRAARVLLIISFLLTITLFVVTSLIIPRRESISLGFTPQGMPVEPGSPERLLLLPFLGTIAYIANLAAGLYLYRQHGYRQIAYMLWMGAVITPLLLLVAIWFMTG